MRSKEDQIKELRSSLHWIICRIEEESDKTLEGHRPNWKAAAKAAVEEAYHALSFDPIDE